MKTLTIATRKSPLALWQADYVKEQLLQQHRHLRIELQHIITSGDRFIDKPLNTAGGKGLFTKELEQALLNSTADIAVHSIKDMTAEMPPGLELAVIMARADASDVFISNHYRRLADLPAGAVLGTSSLRRSAQIKALYNTIEIKPLRGNVDTRLRKLDAGECDAIILAAAGIKRLGLTARINERIPHTTMLPAVGQGAIGIQARAADPKVRTLITALNHHQTALCVSAERAFNRRLSGNCQLPIAAHATQKRKRMCLTGLVAAPTGGQLIKATTIAESDNAEQLGVTLAETLLAAGADKILKAIV